VITASDGVTAEVVRNVVGAPQHAAGTQKSRKSDGISLIPADVEWTSQQGHVWPYYLRTAAVRAGAAVL
jgi:hypothetical protein